MPAYFNLSVLFRRNGLYPTFVKDFYTMLDKAGMKFRSGYWGFEEDSLEETIEWNQQKLEEDFNLGFTEHHSHDYKQVIYRFGGYSEVRGFWMNNYPEDGEFTYEIIIPESDVLSALRKRALRNFWDSPKGYGNSLLSGPYRRAWRLRMTQPALQNWHREDARTPGLLPSWRSLGPAMRIPCMTFNS